MRLPCGCHVLGGFFARPLHALALPRLLKRHFEEEPEFGQLLCLGTLNKDDEVFDIVIGASHCPLPAQGYATPIPRWPEALDYVRCSAAKANHTINTCIRHPPLK